jgi:5-formyltetrahydrofolate cyclo-ligase
MTQTEITAEKSRLRKLLREKRRAVPSELRRLWSGEILRRLTGLREWADAQTVMAYVSMPDEVDTTEILALAAREGRRVLLPRCVPGAKRFEAVELSDPGAPLVPGPFPGLMEPAPETPAWPASASPNGRIDLILVPGLGFDARGGRLGYGAGMYDQFLTDRADTPRFGLAFERQMVERVPTDERDVRMTGVVTEKIIYRT